MVAQLVKGLKPKKLKIKQVRLNILNVLRAEGKIVKKELEKTTATWEGDKPTFEIAIGLTGQDAIVLIGPGGNQKGAQKWVWLDQGTKPHQIKAKNPRIIKRDGKTIIMPPMLTFRDGRGFRSKTKVKTFASRKGANTGSWVNKKEVKHPGNEAREWSITIVKQRKKPFTKAIIEAAQI